MKTSKEASIEIGNLTDTLTDTKPRCFTFLQLRPFLFCDGFSKATKNKNTTFKKKLNLIFILFFR